MLGISGGSAGETVAPFDPVVTVASSAVLGSGGTADWWGRSYFVRRPSDNALVMVYRRGTHHDSTSSTALHIQFRDDDGATWSGENLTLAGGAVSGFPLNPTGGNVSYGEGMPLVAPNGDLIILMWRVDGNSSSGTPKGTWQARSTDGGHTWTQEGQVTSWGGGLNVDRTFATDDWFTHPNGTTYSGARVYNAVPTTDSYVILVRNTTRNLAVGSWEYVSDMTSAGSDTQEVGMEFVGNDRIVGIIRSLNNNVTRKAVSSNMGTSWTVTDVSSSPVGVSGRHRMYTRAHLQGLAGWWKDPVLFMEGFVLQNPGSSQSRRNCVWFSPDRGTIWDGPHYIDSTTEDAGYGDIFWNGSGYSVVSYQGSLTAASLKQYNLTVTGL